MKKEDSMDTFYKKVIAEKNKAIDELERDLFIERIMTGMFYTGFIILYLIK